MIELERKRPFGVTIVIVLQVLSTLSVAFFVIDELEKRSTVHDLRLAAVGGAFVLVGMLIAAGLWRLERWAWVCVMLWTGAELAASLVEFIHRSPDYPSMLAGILVVFYLNQADVQAAFRRRRPTTAPTS